MYKRLLYSVFKTKNETCIMMLDVIHIELILMFKYGHLQNIILYELNINAQTHSILNY